ncbi:MAG: flavodoxin-dependent (E)-4-hydroxy-3-methylbut-2-enyl-diphosphate synthase [Vulcanimicrobiota bacterium]
MENTVQRRVTRSVAVRDKWIGGDAPILVQSMTSTCTADVDLTCAQIERLFQTGCELVRVAVPDMDTARILGRIVERSPLPVAADIHFDPDIALAALDQGVDKLRLNPGNLKRKSALRAIVKKAGTRNVPIRIGVNAGSVDRRLLLKSGGVTPEVLVESAVNEIRLLEDLGFQNIVISMKAFDVPLLLEAHRMLAQVVSYPFHIGVTEAGTLLCGSVRSAVGIGALLAIGMGDTVRVSLTDDPCQEVKIAYEILKALNLRKKGPVIVSCPTCGRTRIDLVSLTRAVEEGMRKWDVPIKVAVMGCVVNGPGEARMADVGVAGGKGEGVIFRKGRIVRKVREADILNALFEEVALLIESGEHRQS